MIVQEQIDDNYIKTYSDAGFYIHGGYPEGNYESAVDPISANRIYTETDIPIESEETTDEEFAEVGKILMGVIE